MKLLLMLLASCQANALMKSNMSDLRNVITVSLSTYKVDKNEAKALIKQIDKFYKDPLNKETIRIIYVYDIYSRKFWKRNNSDDKVIYVSDDWK